MRSSPAAAPPHSVNGLQLQDILHIYPPENLYKVFRVFDPNGSKVLESEGKTAHSLSKIKISARQVMLAGVMMSPLIRTSNKIKFMLSLFDESDSGTLSLKQFSDMHRTWTLALSKVFAVKPAAAEDVDYHCKAAYNRVAYKASQRLMELSRQSAERKMAIIAAIKRKQTGNLNAAAVKIEQSLSKSNLEDMLVRSGTAEPAFLLFTLFLQRFGADRVAGAKSFVEDFETLTYQTEVHIPKEPLRVHIEDLPNPGEVVFIRDVFPRIELGSIERIEQVMAESPMFKFTDTKFQKRLMIHIFEMDLVDFERGGFLGLLHRIYPKALPRHFRLFQQWCREYDELEQKRVNSSQAEAALKEYQDVSRKPIIPAHELDVIKNEFAKLDYDGLGSVEYDVIARYLGGNSQDIAAKYDMDSDDHVSLRDFCRMMCPPQFRMPEMDGFGRRIFGVLLEFIAKEESKSFLKSSESFEKPKISIDTVEASHFQAMLDPVPDDLWMQWQAAFRELDVDGDDVIHINELLAADILSEPVCRYLSRYLDPQLKDSFTLQTFNNAMLQAHGYRKKIAFDGKTPYAEKHIELPKH